jgi:hypothetical protein
MPQGTTDWYRVRRGIVTASEIDALVTPEWKPRRGEGVKTYLCQKIAELLTPMEIDESGAAPSWAADQGHILETLAIPWFEFETGLAVERVGFCLSDDGRLGCSPDGLVGDDAGIETKCPQPQWQVRYLLDQTVPKQYLAQIHASMLVTGRESWWFVSYSQDLPKLCIQVARDEAIQTKLREAIDPFLDTLDREFARVKAMGSVARVAPTPAARTVEPSLPSGLPTVPLPPRKPPPKTMREICDSADALLNQPRQPQTLPDDHGQEVAF